MSTIQYELWDQKIGEPGLYIEYFGRKILFDAPFMLFDRNIKTASLQNIHVLLLTHRHRDHFGGIDRLFFEVDTFPFVIGNKGTVQAVNERFLTYDINLINPHMMSGKDVFAFEFPSCVFETASYTINAVSLSHGNIESIAFSFEEKPKVKLDKNKLAESGFPSGSWVREAKQAIEQKNHPKYIQIGEKTVDFSHVQELFFVQNGIKIVYASDFSISQQNQERLIRLAHKADHLFCEAAYLNEDRELAIKNHHQTVGEVAQIAKEAQCAALHLFHHSRRYQRTSNAEETFLQQATQIFPNVV